jgi:glycosyltransferase involved in cell wall biosynthesis
MVISNMANYDAFTVLMAVYYKDDPVLFSKALSSVYANTLLPNAVVIVADGPLTNDLESVISNFTIKDGFKLVRLDKNVGLPKALNIGLESIDTDYVFRADSDDVNLPDRFLTQMIYLNKGYDLVGSDILEFDVDGTSLGKRVLPRSQNELLKFVKKRNPFNHMTVAYRKSLVLRVGGYPNIYLKEDYALWASLMSIGAKMVNINSVLVHVNAGQGMYRRRGGLRYAFAEIALQKHLYKKGLKTFSESIFDGILRSLIFCTPQSFRQFVYEKFLRDF